MEEEVSDAVTEATGHEASAHTSIRTRTMESSQQCAETTTKTIKMKNHKMIKKKLREKPEKVAISREDVAITAATTIQEATKAAEATTTTEEAGATTMTEAVGVTAMILFSLETAATGVDSISKSVMVTTLR